MKWLILLFSLITIDIYLSSLTLEHIGPLLLICLYTMLLATGAIVLFSRRHALTTYFQTAIDNREDVKPTYKKETKVSKGSKKNKVNKVNKEKQEKQEKQEKFPLIQISLAALATFLLFIPGGITSCFGIVLATKNTSNLITNRVLKKTVAQ